MASLRALTIVAFLAVSVLRLSECQSQCTSEQLKGFDVIGYAADRVFRMKYKGKAIDLWEEFGKMGMWIEEKEVVTFSTSSVWDFNTLVRLHQGFKSQLVVMLYGNQQIDFDDKPYRMDGPKLGVRYYSSLLNSTSIKPMVALPSDTAFAWEHIAGYERVHDDVTTFNSFLYGNKIYVEHGYTPTEHTSGFVRYAQDICKGFPFPVADIATYPPKCYSRKMHTAPSKGNLIADDEWIVAVVNEAMTTRSKEACASYKQYPEDEADIIWVGDEKLEFASKENHCYFLKKRGMGKPCLFAFGNIQLFQEVQLLPLKPIPPPTQLLTTSTTPPHAPPTSTEHPLCITNAHLHFDETFEVFEYVQDCIVRHMNLSSALASGTPVLDDCTTSNSPVAAAKFLPVNETHMIMLSAHNLRLSSNESACSLMPIPARGGHVPMKPLNASISYAGDLLLYRGSVLQFYASYNVVREILYREGYCDSQLVQEDYYDTGYHKYNVADEPFATMIYNYEHFSRRRIEKNIGGFAITEKLRVYEHTECSPFDITIPIPDDRKIFLARRFPPPVATEDQNEDLSEIEKDDEAVATPTMAWIICFDLLITVFVL